MAHASGKHHGAGVQGKGDGTGAMTMAEDVAAIPENAILSNRDKAARPPKDGQASERGLDSRAVAEEQMQDGPMSRHGDDAEGAS